MNMKTYPVTADDLKLIEEAMTKIKTLYKENRHHVSAALRTLSGEIVSAVHIEANVGRVAVCAEAIAIGSAMSNGHKGFDTIVAVRHPYSDEPDQEITVVSPCGICRELISDYAPDCYVLLEVDHEIVKTTIDELIPYKYKRE
ncbi:cytidine deaminase [Microbacteriaceae bacterium 4G12]